MNQQYVSFAGLGKSQESQAVSSRKVTEEKEPEFLRTAPQAKVVAVSPRKVTSDFPRHPNTQSPDLVQNIFKMESQHKRVESNPFDLAPDMRQGSDKRPDQPMSDPDLSHIENGKSSRENQSLMNRKQSNFMYSEQSGDLDNFLHNRKSTVSKKNLEEEILHSASQPNFSDIFANAGSGVQETE